MSDYPNPNIHRGDGVSGRGLLIALLVIVGFVVLLAIFGGGGDAPTTTGTPLPAETAPATTAPVATE